jgi:heparin/heparan-sulfate lyase
MDWCRLPGNKEFGAGDSFHNNNLLPKDIPTHIKEIANLFGRNHPKVLDWASELVALYNKGYNPMRMTFMPLLHNFNFTLDEYTEPAKHKSCVTHFESLGQIIMRTGRGDNDTYAMFMTGRSNDQHQHFDINNFTIYKHGYRALDSGTRPQPGLHLSHYYARTVAHNCITIRMPGEEMPHYWGGAAKEEDENTPFPNDGGQRVRNKGKLLALNESDDYVYIASDATEA